MGDDLLAVPVGRQIDLPTIGTDMVVLRRHVERVLPVELIAPCKTDIDIFRVAEAVEFPHSRHLHRLPIGVVQVGFVEVRWALVGIGHPKKFPRSFECQVVGRAGDVARKRFLPILIGEETGMHRETVDLVDLLVVPFRPRWLHHAFGRQGLLCGACSQSHQHHCG